MEKKMRNKMALTEGRRRIRRGIAAALLTVFLTLTAGISAVSAADAFKMVKSTPADGFNRVQAQNVMVKLYFNDRVDKAAEQNGDKFTFTDNKGKKVKFKIYYDDSEKNMIALLVTKDLAIDKKYKIEISPDLVNNEGEALGAKEVISFGTKQSSGGLIYALLMVAMVVVMIFFTIRDQRKKAEEDVAAEGKPVQAKQKNPYKLAKEKGISVEEAAKLINKEREKEQKKLDKKLEKQKRRTEKIEKQIEEELEEYQIFRVHTKRVVKRSAKSEK